MASGWKTGGSGSWGTGGMGSSGLAGLLSFTPTPKKSPHPAVAPTPAPAVRGPSSPSLAGLLAGPAPRPAPRPAAPAPAPVGGGGGGGSYGGGGFGTSDGYSPYATPALGQDPAYLAFLRALGIEKSDLNQSAEDRISVINREIARRLPDILQQGTYAREGIDNNFASRGIFRSGHRLESIARQRADEGQQTSALQGAAADQVFLIRQELARRLADAERRGTEQNLTSAGNVYR